jgi:serine/threonine-protein kinase
MKIGDYEILSQLGAGGMGRVYKVKNELSDRVEAMKVLLPDLEGQTELANRFLREIKVQAGMDHPNIAKLYTALRIDNQLLMFMEFVEGITLDQRLRQGPIPMGDALEYSLQVLEALEYAHERGVVHRDIKPANMMLMPNGRIKLLDFGIAKASVDSRLTMTGTTLGSLYYMAPEQIQGGSVDLRSDLYSVGVSLYELATGTKPFDGESQFAIMSAHLARPPVAPTQVKADVPPSLSEIILLALSKDPLARFQTAGAFLNALQSVQTETGAPTLPPAPAARGSMGRTTAPWIPSGTGAVPLPSAPLDSVPAMTAHGGITQSPPPLPPPPPQPQTQFQSSPQPQPDAFRLIEPTEAAAAKSGPKRFVWAAVGSLCAVGAIVAFIQFGPRGKTSAKETPAPPIAQSSPQPSVEIPPPLASSAAQSLQPPAAQPPAAQPPAAQPPSAAPSTTAGGADPRRPAASSQRAQNQAKPVAGGMPQPRQQAPQQPDPQPQAATPQAAQQPPPAQQAPPPDAGGYGAGRTSLPAAVNKNRMDVNQLSDELDMMVVRARAIRVSLNELQKAQSAQGTSLRGDWVEAFNAMNLHLRKANQAINDGNAAEAKNSMAKAAVQMELLEKGLGR